jgi:hypothetical protein
MAGWRPPVTNRTAADIEQKTTKGYFNLEDWIRIYGNALKLHDLVELLIPVAVPFTTIPILYITEIMSVARVNTLLVNIETIKTSTGFGNLIGLTTLKTDWTAGLTVIAPTYIDVNTWENNELILWNALINFSNDRISCKVGKAGQSRIRQRMFRVYSLGTFTETSNRYARCGVAISGAGINRQNKWRGYL